MRREVGVSTFSEETFGYNCIVPQDENLSTCASSTTNVLHPGASTLISAPQSKQLAHQNQLLSTFLIIMQNTHTHTHTHE